MAGVIEPILAVYTPPIVADSEQNMADTYEPLPETALRDGLAFLKIDATTSDRIKELKSQVERELPVALGRFYDQVKATPATGGLVATEAAMVEAKRVQSAHWGAIANGEFDSQYLVDVQNLSQAHLRVGLEPHWYVAGCGVIAEHLVSSIVADLWPKTFFRRGQEEAGKSAGAAVGALVKAIFLEMNLSIATCVAMAKADREKEQVAVAKRAKEQSILAVAEDARQRAQVEELGKDRAAIKASMGAALSKLAAKDLGYRINEAVPQAYAQLRVDFNSALDQMQGAFQELRNSIESAHAGTQEISTASRDLSHRTEQQAATLEETTAAVNEITASVDQTAAGVKGADALVAETRDAAQSGTAVVKKAIEAIRLIENSSQKISQIIAVIDEIAFQTNLLALNAGVEAARAGDAGRGFAVVASEVRALAQRTAESAKEIKTLVASSATEVAGGVALVLDTGKALTKIETLVAGLNEAISGIDARSAEQARALKEVNTAVKQMDQVTQQNASMAEEATAASETLAKETHTLSNLVAEFKIDVAKEDQLRRRQAAEQAGKPAASDASSGDLNFDDAVMAHLNWKVKLRTAMMDDLVLDAETISRDNACPLGKWLHGGAKTKYGQLASYHGCVHAHADFHREAGKVAVLINQKKHAEAEAALANGAPFTAASNTAVLAITQMKEDAALPQAA